MTPQPFKVNYQSIFKDSPFSIIILNSSGEIVEINSKTEEIYGIKRDIIHNKRFTDLFNAYDNDILEIKNILKEVLASNNFGPKDIQISTHEGKKLWLNIVASIIQVGDDQLIQVITQDFTHLKNLELELKESEEIYRYITDSTIDLLTIVDSGFKIKYINAKVHEKKMGYFESDLINSNPIYLIHPDDQELVVKAFKDVLKTGESVVTARIKKKDGQYIWFESNGTIFKDSAGKIMCMIVSRDVSERIKNENKLQDSQTRYRELTNSLPEVIFEVDLDFNLTYTNLIASKIFGYSHEDFKRGLTVFNFLHPDEKNAIIDILNRLFKGDQVKPEIVRLKKKDGTYIHMRAFLSPIYDEDKIIGGRSILHDITDLREAEEKIKQSEEKFRTIAEQSLLGISIIQDEKVKYVNNVLVQLLGYSKEEMIAWRSGEFLKTIHPDDKKRVIELATLPDENFPNGIRSYEARAVNKSGKIIWMDVYYKKIIFEDKPALLISFNDISAKKEAEENLRDSEERYRFLFQNSPFSILLIDHSGKIIDCNSSLEKLIGYEKSEIINKKYNKILVVIENYIPLLLERLKRISKGESLPPLDIELKRKDGKIIWANIESSLMKIGNQVFIIIMGHDISVKKEAEEKLRELDVMRREFIDRASHELKTPITTVFGAYQLLNTLYMDRFDAEVLELLEMAFSGIKRLKKLVDDLLDVSKLESRTVKLEKTETDLSELIKECLKELNYLIIKREQEIKLELPDELWINVDRLRIELVITNLLTNAIKYTPIEGKILIKLKKMKDYIELTIEDTGIGLTKTEIQKLFKRFTKIPTPYDDKIDMDLGSTGLGLHITKAIVELHDGTITAKSAGRGKGSTFVVRLPLVNNSE